LGESFQRVSRRRLLFRHGNAHIASQPDRLLGSQVKIALRQVRPASTLGYKRMVVPHLATRIVELQPRPARHEDYRDPGVIESGGELIEPSDSFPFDRNQ